MMLYHVVFAHLQHVDTRLAMPPPRIQQALPKRAQSVRHPDSLKGGVSQ